MGSYTERPSHLINFKSTVQGLRNQFSLSMTRILIALAFILALLTWTTNNHLSYPKQLRDLSRVSENDLHLPDVIIYRRTKKTGSSSMLEEILRETSSYGYVPLYHTGKRMINAVRAEGMKSQPRRLLVAQHNHVTRQHTLGRKTVVMDTFFDGYKQMTSYCRYSLKVRECDDRLIDCLRGPGLKERYYRWAGGTEENDDTYIDIPLSSEYPALSTTAFRHVFPSAVLDVKHRNAANSTCPENPRIREVYETDYKEFDKFIDELRRRLLSLVGYPLISRTPDITLSDILDAAEILEKEKYLKEEHLAFGNHERMRRVSQAHAALQGGVDMWERDANGKVTLITRSEMRAENRK